MDLKFAPFASSIELPFYVAFFNSKLEHDMLDDSARPVLGLYEPHAESSAVRMQILGNSLTSNTVPLGSTRAEGIIKNFNTIEDFKNYNKTAMIQNSGKQIWDAIKDGTIYSVPSLLSSFTVLSYADLKKYKFTYWFGFPALHSEPQWKRTGPVGKINSNESIALVERVGTWRYSVDSREHGFFLAKKVRGDKARPMSPTDEPSADIGYRWDVGSLRDFENGFFNDVPAEDQFVAFVDASNYADSPSWPLRNLLVLIRQRYHLDQVQILCYRDVQSRRHEARSIILPLAMDKVEQMETPEIPKVTGWERSSDGSLRARVANLAEYMDPTRIADQAVDLNLKLMRWRISPNLDLDTIKSTKCLLLGAGTLGSYVSRNLMGWGVRKITFVDYGTVSFSNPVRQPLFEFDDCLNGGKRKALQAAEALKKIYPGVETEGHVLSVPMLGHAFIDKAKTKAEFEKLQTLINEHDVVFLLMDSRESRWLPTVMAKSAGKIVLNAALGFDTYVVMRHGARPTDGTEDTLGCYFCNDVVSPANSMKDQTLDQQCTVTRPGVAAIASALAVELLASVLQHPQKQHAPAPVARQDAPNQPPTYEREPADHALGIVPHQIRGFLSTFENKIIRGQSYPYCSACSAPILGAYEKDSWGFVEKALADRDFVTELSGLAEVQRKAEAAAADVEWSEEEENIEGEDEEGVMIDAGGPGQAPRM